MKRSEHLARKLTRVRYPSPRDAARVGRGSSVAPSARASARRRSGAGFGRDGRGGGHARLGGGEQGAQMVDAARAHTVERDALGARDESIPEAAGRFDPKFSSSTSRAGSRALEADRPPAPGRRETRGAPRRAARVGGGRRAGEGMRRRALACRARPRPRERRRAFVWPRAARVARLPVLGAPFVDAGSRARWPFGGRRPRRASRAGCAGGTSGGPGDPTRRRARRAFRKGREPRAPPPRARSRSARASRHLARSRRRPRRRRRRVQAAKDSSRRRTQTTSSRRRWSSSSNDPSARASPRPIRGSAGAMKPRPLSPWCSGTIRARSPTATTAATS